MSDYPKQMVANHSKQVVTVFAAPDRSGVVPVIWPTNKYGLVDFARLSPLPSPDDIVQVTVEMTRAQRDEFTYPNGRHTEDVWRLADALMAACRAHRDAEEAP